MTWQTAHTAVIVTAEIAASRRPKEALLEAAGAPLSAIIPDHCLLATCDGTPAAASALGLFVDESVSFAYEERVCNDR